jgi:hypothetical protein
MPNLSTTIAVYPDLPTALADWAGIEAAAEADAIDLADAALVEKGTDGAFQTAHRQSHHGASSTAEEVQEALDADAAS